MLNKRGMSRRCGGLIRIKQYPKKEKCRDCIRDLCSRKTKLEIEEIERREGERVLR
jgi:hypothetical protein